MDDLPRVLRVRDVDDPEAVVVAVERKVALERDVGADVPDAVGVAEETRGMRALSQRVHVDGMRAGRVVCCGGPRQGEDGRGHGGDEHE